MPSYGGAHGPDGSKKSGDQGQGSRDSRGGQTGGSRSGGGFGGERGTLGQQQDRRNMEAARRAGNAAPGVKNSNDRGTLAQQQDRINTNRALARSNTAPGVGNYSKAMDDFNNVGQGFFDDPLGAIGRFFGSGFGVGEIDPSTQAPKSFLDRTTASWGIDPIGAALGIGGSFLGPAGTLLSGLYSRGLKPLTGWQGPMIAFDGNQPVSGGFSMPGFDGVGGGAPNSGGQMAQGNTGNAGQTALQGLLGAPTVAPTAPKPPSAASAPQSLWNYKPATYTPINASGLMDYGVWSPQHKYAA